jgi:hypothetical protein
MHMTNTLFRPVGQHVVFIALLSFITNIFMFYFIYRVSSSTFPSTKLSLSSAMLMAFRPLFVQTIEIPKNPTTSSNFTRIAIKLILVPWIFCCILLTEIYKGNIFSFLFIPSYDPIPRDFPNLISSGYTIFVQTNSHRAITQDEIYKEILRSKLYFTDLEKKFRLISLSIDDVGALYRQVARGNGILLAPIEYIILYERLFSVLIGQGSYQSSKDTISGHKVWLLFKRVSPATGYGIQEESSAIFRTLYEAGIYTFLRNMYYRGFGDSFMRGMFTIPGIREQFYGTHTPNASESNASSSSSFPQDGPKAIGLQHVNVFFVVLLVGLLAATQVFVFQFFVLHRAAIRRRVFCWHRETYQEAMLALSYVD